MKGDFHLSDEVGKGEMSEVGWLCVDTYNNQWLLKAKPLGLQIRNLLLGLLGDRGSGSHLKKEALTTTGIFQPAEKGSHCPHPTTR